MQHSKNVFRHITDVLSTPTVLKGMLESWPSRKWSPKYLASVLQEKKLNIRTGPVSAKKLSSVLWEADCIHEEATLEQFCEWLSNDGTPSLSENQLLKYDREEHWCYVDYKQMAFLFEDHPEILKAVQWSDLGFPDRDGRQSTIWIGSEGAFTPGHYDTYGFNLVAQIYGRKRWHLFPPSQTHLLCPTRIPYEESSVFSPINIANPSLERYPKFAEATPYVVTLEPGDVLFVPKHWWHFVESLEVSISVNTWVEVESDKESRVQEAVTRVLVSTFMSTSCGPRKWVNPTETICNDEINYRYVGAALKECSHISPQPLGAQAASATSEFHSGKKQVVQTQDLPPHRHNIGSDYDVLTEAGNHTAMETRKNGQSATCDICNFQPDNQTIYEPSNTAKLTERRLHELEEEDRIEMDPSSGAELKRHQGDMESTTPSKLPKTDPNHFDQEQSTDAFPNFIARVICQGQIYKESKQDDSCSSDVNLQDGDVNMQMRSEVRPDVCVEDLRQMLVECVTHPDVLSLMAALLQEKFDHKL